MKAFLLWLGLSFVAFAAAGIGYHIYLGDNPHRTFVAVDDSHDMKRVWNQVPAVLGRLNAARYTQYALATTKARVHGWQPEIELGALTPIAPRNLSRLTGGERFPEIGVADRRIFLTNAPDTALQALEGFEIIRID